MEVDCKQKVYQYTKGTTVTQEEIRIELIKLFNDPDMITQSSYSPAAGDWPDSQLPFVEYHMTHLTSHKLTNAETYLSNLRLMVKKR